MLTNLELSHVKLVRLLEQKNDITNYKLLHFEVDYIKHYLNRYLPQTVIYV